MPFDVRGQTAKGTGETGGGVMRDPLGMGSSGAGRIVVGVDGSRFGIGALRWGLQEGARRGCAVEATMGWHPESHPTGPQPVGAPHRLPDELREVHAEALAASVAEATRGQETPQPRQVLARGWPPELLVRASMDAVLLVLGGHGRGKLMDSAVGSVIEYCIRHAYCPVVVVPPRLAIPASGAPEAVSASRGVQ
jgi:nucleotide-binding universal stress UspA family protein